MDQYITGIVMCIIQQLISKTNNFKLRLKGLKSHYTYNC